MALGGFCYFGSVNRNEIWQYQEGLDTHASFVAFRYFLGLTPPRELKNVCIGTEFNLNTVRAWSSSCRWFSRAAAWDDYMARIAAEETESIVRRTAEERATKALLTLERMHAILDHEVLKLHAQSVGTALPVMNAAQMVKLAESAIKLERLVRGDTTENVGNTLDLTQLTDEELAALDALSRKAEVK